jgi:hypothetical protein
MLEPRRGSSARVRVRTPPSLISPVGSREQCYPRRTPEVTLFPRDPEIRERGRGSLGDSRGPTSAHARVPAETRGCRSVPGRARGCAALGTRRHLRDPSPRPRKLTSKVGGNRVSTTRDSANRLGSQTGDLQKPRKKVFSVLTRSQKDHSRLVARNRGGSRIRRRRASSQAPSAHVRAALAPRLEYRAAVTPVRSSSEPRAHTHARTTARVVSRKTLVFFRRRTTAGFSS